MKIHLVSDLHLEFAPYPNGAPKGTDVVIAAGDIMKGPKGPFLLREIFGDYVPIVYIAGNHEYYAHDITTNRMEILKYAEMYNVHYLDNDFCVIDGVTFVGGTLWTDFELHGEPNRIYSMHQGAAAMNDYRLITRTRPDGKKEKFRPADAIAEHKETLAKIRLVLEHKETEKAVVVTHMAPHPKSIHPKYSGDTVNPCYASDLEKTIVEFAPDLWVHGHMHDSFDYMVDKTRVVCNPRGYVFDRSDLSKSENMKFNPELLIDI